MFLNKFNNDIDSSEYSPIQYGSGFGDEEKSNTLLIIIIVVVVLLILGGIGYFIMSKNSTPVPTTPNYASASANYAPAAAYNLPTPAYYATESPTVAATTPAPTTQAPTTQAPTTTILTTPLSTTPAPTTPNLLSQTQLSTMQKLINEKINDESIKKAGGIFIFANQLKIEMKNLFNTNDDSNKQNQINDIVQKALNDYNKDATPPPTQAPSVSYILSASPMVPQECSNGEDLGTSCRETCKNGYHAVGPMCWEDNKPGMVDVGTLVREGCKDGYHDVAGVCWEDTPSGAVDVGALIRDACRGGYHDVAGVCWNNDSNPYNGQAPSYVPTSRARSSYIPSTVPRKSYGSSTYPKKEGCPPNKQKYSNMCYDQCPKGFSMTSPGICSK